MKSRNPVLPLEYYCPAGEPHLVNGELFVYPNVQISSLIVDGTDDACVSYELAKNGELTIFIEARQQIEIKSFSMK